MDSRDEDDVLSVAMSLAKEAAMLFQSGKYAECLDVLKQLSQKKDNDPKVLHNTALAEFFRGGCSDPDRFFQELTNIEKKCADLARESAEQLDATSHSGCSTSSVSSGTNVVGPLVHVAKRASVVFRDEFDASVATLNKAVILYHLHDYPQAIRVLEPLFQNIEPIDEGAALRVCLLLLDLALSTQDASKFAGAVSYVEKAFHARMDNQANISEASADTSEDSLSRTLFDVYRILLSRFNMTFQKLAKPSIPLGYTDSPSTPSNRLPSVDISEDSPSTPNRLPSVDFKLNIPLYRVQRSLLTKNIKVAKRNLTLATNIAGGKDCSSALLLKSQLELSRGDYVKAEMFLKGSHKHEDVGSSIIYNNNVGCIFYEWGKPNAAGVFFNKALRSCSSLHTEKPRKFAKLLQDRSLLVMYNSGMHYMACGNPVLAAKCFQKASLVFYDKPLLWLRLAECSLIASDKGLSKSFDKLLSELEFEASVIGRGKWRQLAVGGVGCERYNNLSVSSARHCLLNAFLLLESTEPEPGKYGLALTTPGESSAVGGTKKSNNRPSSSQANANKDMKGKKHRTAMTSFALYADRCRRKTLEIKQAILANLAFVELVLEDPVAALARARSLLEVPECSKISAFLARVYSAEALCLLNRPEEAAELLSVYFSGGKNIKLPYTKEDYKQWQVKKPSDPDNSNAGSVGTTDPETDEEEDSVFYKPEEARGALYLNLASVSLFNGDLELAFQYATQALSRIPDSREANLMAVYLDLKRGRVEEARTRLRSCTCVRYTSSVSRRPS